MGPFIFDKLVLAVISEELMIIRTLSSNSFSGPIPSSLSKLPTLAKLYNSFHTRQLDSNNFSGPFPNLRGNDGYKALSYCTIAGGNNTVCYNTTESVPKSCMDVTSINSCSDLKKKNSNNQPQAYIIGHIASFLLTLLAI